MGKTGNFRATGYSMWHVVVGTHSFFTGTVTILVSMRCWGLASSSINIGVFHKKVLVNEDPQF